MELNALMNAQDYSVTQAQVQSFNKTLAGVSTEQTLNKDDFLKLLITQLTHQDPTEPMNDREFIAQMAQFSTLEQITNMSQDFGKLSGILSTSQALGMLGKTVEVVSGETVVEGVVAEVIGREYPRLLVDGRYYDLDQVERIKE
jgi:flagellar basal-body rod modification protein FlgD